MALLTIITCTIELIIKGIKFTKLNSITLMNILNTNANDRNVNKFTINFE